MKVSLLMLVLATSACGYSQRGNVILGQIKGIHRETPLLCPDWIYVDVSLGVMRNGVGSMSTEDKWINLTEDQATKAAAIQASGHLVEITYDHKRFVFCGTDNIARKVEEKL